MTTARTWIILVLALLLCTSIWTSVAYAWNEYDVNDRDAVSRGADVDHWGDGQWFHGDHLGRVGWRWIVGSGWYFYPAPVYPYPDPYAYTPRAEAPYVTECPWGWRLVTPQSPRS